MDWIINMLFGCLRFTEKLDGYFKCYIISENRKHLMRVGNGKAGYSSL